jgi:hypothetical protein
MWRLTVTSRYGFAPLNALRAGLEAYFNGPSFTLVALSSPVNNASVSNRYGGAQAGLLTPVTGMYRSQCCPLVCFTAHCQ